MARVEEWREERGERREEGAEISIISKSKITMGARDEDITTDL